MIIIPLIILYTHYLTHCSDCRLEQQTCHCQLSISVGLGEGSGCRGFLQELPWFYTRVAVVFSINGKKKSTPSLSNSGRVRTLKTERRSTKSVLDVPWRLPLKFHQNWVSYSRDIPEKVKYRQDKCCLDKCHRDSQNLF